MKAKVDAGGRLMIPKQYREKYGITPNSEVDVSEYGSGLQITPVARTATVIRDESGRLVIRGEGIFTDEMLYRMIDEDRQWPRDS